jgi:hypothetical protein
MLLSLMLLFEYKLKGLTNSIAYLMKYCGLPVLFAIAVCVTGWIIQVKTSMTSTITALC